jgi:ATPase family protein associated with various cellular activities (AAA)/winged helix domain-containing protein
MSDYDAWLKANDEYLSTALAWLRARLAALAPAGAAPVPATSVVSMASGGTVGWLPRQEPASRSLWDRVLGRPAPLVAPAIPATPLAAATGNFESLGPALETLEKAESPPALVLLARRFDLTAFERRVLLLAAAPELDTRIAALCARAQGDPGRPFPTFALALALFDEPSWDVLSPERPLRFWRLIEILQPAGQPLTAGALRADERIVNYVKGLNYLDERLAPLVRPLDVPELHLELPGSHAAAIAAVLEGVRNRAPGQRLPVVELIGADRATQQLVAARAAGELGLRVYALATEAIPPAPAEADTLARLWDREAALLPLALYLDEPEGDGAAVDRFAERVRSLVFLAGREPRPAVGGVPLMVDTPRASRAEQRAAWTALAGPAFPVDAAALASQFDLSVTAIQQAAEEVRAESADPATADARLWAACLAMTRPRLERLAHRIEARAGWDDLVLPAEPLAVLRQLVAQVRQRSRVYDEWGFGETTARGLGISALFAGESGTGKTMAAEVIARALRLDLFRIDLSAVMSKYIGETEKNLRQVFDAAEYGGAILLFDEADALFGKRGEVKDSHDRYANIEIDYLLQRLEAYRGLAILTTNLRSAMDPAFVRRLRFIVEFPFPGLPDRKRMWRQAFPAGAATGELDFDRLARLALTGGSIRNVALNAAFLAADAGESIAMPHVLAAARGEFRKLERPVNEAEFRVLVAAEAKA